MAGNGRVMGEDRYPRSRQETTKRESKISPRRARARLVGKRFGFGGDRVIVHCYYRDMLGNDFAIEQDATLECRPTWPARAGG